MKFSWEQELIELFNSAPIVKNFGMSLSFDEEQHAHVVLPYNPNLDHPLQGVHGGVIATLLDTVGWFAIAVRHEGVWVATSEFKTHLLQPVKECELRAEGWTVKDGKRLSVAEMRTVDQEGDLVALGTGTFIVLDTIPFRKDAS